MSEKLTQNAMAEFNITPPAPDEPPFFPIMIRFDVFEKALAFAYENGFKAAAEIVRDPGDRYGIGSMCSQWTSSDVADDVLEQGGLKRVAA